MFSKIFGFKKFKAFPERSFIQDTPLNVDNVFETIWEMDGIGVLHCGCVLANQKAAFAWFFMENVRRDICKNYGFDVEKIVFPVIEYKFQPLTVCWKTLI